MGILHTVKTHCDEFATAIRTCESEPIHIPNRIQAHGAMLVVSADLNRVLEVSANIEQFLGVSPSCVLDKPLSAVLGEANARRILDLPVHRDSQPSVPTLFQYNSRGITTEFVAEVHRVCGDWVIEIEPSSNVERERFASLFVSIRAALWEADAEQELTNYCGLVADQVRTLTEFDRVMVYRFDHDWNGEVIAESRNSRLPSLLGNHFPASDIPVQARELYARNLFRALADTEAQPVELVPPTHPVTGETLDMSYATLRSMSPIHIEYLRNMGARATMSLSLIVDGKLWGLIACHHADARRVPFDVRGLALFMGTAASLRLANLESVARSGYLAKVQETLLSVTRQVSQANSLEDILTLADRDIRGLFKASGSVIGIDGRRFEFGRVPPPGDIDALVEWLEDQFHSDVFVTECLQDHFPPAKEYPHCAAGLLAVRLDSDLKNFTLWFREETAKSIRWAGQPLKSLVQTSAGPRIEPRRSFAQWIEEQQGHALAWTEPETDSAQAFTFMLTEMLSQTALKSKDDETEARRLAQRLQSDIDDAAQYLRSVLPDDLTGPISTSSRYLPSQTLGGDCFDFRWLDDDHLVFYLLDVSGHGMRSALVAVSVQNMLRSGGIRTETLLEPDQVLAALNTYFAMDSHDGTYFTMWFGVYQRSTRILRYSGGGHPPALLFNGATHTQLAAEGPPVGMFDDVGFPAATLNVPPGSRILLYSDGAYELPLDDSGRQATHDDFIKVCGRLAESPHWSLDELVDALHRRSVTNSFHDDCCLVVVSFD